METAVEGIITFDQQGIIDSFNRAAERMFGYAAEQMIGRQVRVLLGHSCQGADNDFPAECLQPESTNTLGIRCEVAGIRKDGSEFPMDLAINEVRVGDLRFFTGFVRDITDHKREEQRERLAAMGHMISTVAHESRNSLQLIQAGVDILRLDLEDNPELIEQLDRIEKAGGNLTRLYERAARVCGAHHP